MNYHARFYGNNSNDYRTMQVSYVALVAVRESIAYCCIGASRF